MIQNNLPRPHASRFILDEPPSVALTSLVLLELLLWNHFVSAVPGTHRGMQKVSCYYDSYDDTVSQFVAHGYVFWKVLFVWNLMCSRSRTIILSKQIFINNFLTIFIFGILGRWKGTWPSFKGTAVHKGPARYLTTEKLIRLCRYKIKNSKMTKLSDRSTTLFILSKWINKYHTTINLIRNSIFLL